MHVLCVCRGFLTARSLCPDTILPRVEALRFSHSWPVSSASSTYMPNTKHNSYSHKMQAMDFATDYQPRFWGDVYSSNRAIGKGRINKETDM
jgi:hypothetical protein